MGAVNIGGQWFYLQADGTRLGPFPNENEAVMAGAGAVGPYGNAPVTTPTGNTPGTTYDPNDPIIGSSVPAAGGSLVYVGSDVAGTPKFQFVPARSENPTVVVNDKLVDALTGRVIADLSGTQQGTLSPNTIYTQQQIAAREQASREAQAAQQQAALAEEQRQFNETFGANKARFNIEQQNALAESERQRQFQREQTLLQLGSRPDTLIRYLYALRGQQPPQGLTTTALPGFQRATQPATASVSPLVEGLDVPSPTASVFPSTPAGAPVGQAITVGPAGQQTTVVPNPTYNVPANLVPMLTPQQVQQTRGITLTGPGANAPTVAPSAQPTGIPQIPLPASGAGIADAARAGFHSFTGVPTSAAQNPNPGQPFYPFGLTRSPEEEAAFVAKRDREADINEAKARGGYARGGVIPEPVIGMGMMSGQMYTFGENAMRGDREIVVPEHKVPKDMFERLMDGAEEVHYSEDKSGKRSVRVKRQTMNSYANGGPLGYRDIDPSVFNPPSMSNTFGFPQIPNLTGGTSLIPSSQRLFNALPSERALFSGYLRDEAGVQPDDVFEIARRLAPQGGMRAGRYVN